MTVRQQTSFAYFYYNVPMTHDGPDEEREKRPLPTWEQMTRDTSPEVQAVLLRLQREMPFWRKWELMDDLIQTRRMFA